MSRRGWLRYLSLAAVLPFLSLAPAQAGDVTVKLQGNYTVTTGTSKISIPTSWMQAGHVYTLTSAPVSGNVSAYGDPYLWGVVYVDGSTTRRVVSQSRHTPDLGERAHLQEDMWNTGENKAEFWVRCEVASCYMKLTVYEREEGTFDRKTFYREGVEPGVIDGQFSVYKDFYHPTEKYGDYGLQVDYEPDRYIYLYRQDNFSTAGMNALSLWVRSSGSIDENDLWIALTTGDHYLLTNWLPMSDRKHRSKPHVVRGCDPACRAESVRKFRPRPRHQERHLRFRLFRRCSLLERGLGRRRRSVRNPTPT